MSEDATQTTEPASPVAPIKVKKPRKPLTEEQKVARRESAAKARAARKKMAEYKASLVGIKDEGDDDSLAAAILRDVTKGEIERQQKKKEDDAKHFSPPADKVADEVNNEVKGGAIQPDAEDEQPEDQAKKAPKKRAANVKQPEPEPQEEDADDEPKPKKKPTKKATIRTKKKKPKQESESEPESNSESEEDDVPATPKPTPRRHHRHTPAPVATAHPPQYGGFNWSTLSSMSGMSTM
jgi:hypothetical protein